MLINEDLKLDYSDVLIRPKRSRMSSRGEVRLQRTHRFLWSKKKWTGIPIMFLQMCRKVRLMTCFDCVVTTVAY